MDAHNEKLRQQFEKRQEARIAELQKKKENSAAKQPAGENAEAFTRLFTQEISKITEMLVNLDGGLSKYVGAASLFSFSNVSRPKRDLGLEEMLRNTENFLREGPY